MPIREFARQTGLSVDTLRYYERIGLIDRVERVGGGHRRYSARDLAWVAFLSRLRETGMSIAEMGRFAALRRAGDTTVEDHREMLEAYRLTVEANLASLRSNLAAIESKIEHYRAMEANLEPRTNPGPIRAGTGEAS